MTHRNFVSAFAPSLAVVTTVSAVACSSAAPAPAPAASQEQTETATFNVTAPNCGECNRFGMTSLPGVKTQGALVSGAGRGLLASTACDNARVSLEQLCASAGNFPGAPCFDEGQCVSQCVDLKMIGVVCSANWNGHATNCDTSQCLGSNKACGTPCSQSQECSTGSCGPNPGQVGAVCNNCCGDGQCGANENCSSCPGDCGSCTSTGGGGSCLGGSDPTGGDTGGDYGGGGNDQPVCSPVIVDLDGRGFHLTDAAGGVRFDIRADGRPVQLAWTSAKADDAFLALDRNDNGKIDDGKELFGNVTDQPSSKDRNGFAALAVFDDGDGVIDARDRIYGALRLWVDHNHDGISQPQELVGLPAADVKALSLKYRPSRKVDSYGNLFRYTARVFPLGAVDPRDRADDVDVPGPRAYDVFLKLLPNE